MLYEQRRGQLRHLQSEFEEIHRLVISPSNTLLISTTQPTVAALHDLDHTHAGAKGLEFRFAATLPFDLHAQLLSADYTIVGGRHAARRQAFSQLRDEINHKACQLITYFQQAATRTGQALLNSNAIVAGLQSERSKSSPGGNTADKQESRQRLVHAVLLRKLQKHERERSLNYIDSVEEMYKDLTAATSNFDLLAIEAKLKRAHCKMLEVASRREQLCALVPQCDIDAGSYSET